MGNVAMGLVNIWVEVLINFMQMFTHDFWEGIEVPSMRFNSGIPTLSNVTPFTGGSTPFDTYFPGVDTLSTSFILIGSGLCVFLMLVGVMLAFLPEGMASDAEHPGRVVLRFACAFILTAYAFQFMAVVFTPMAGMFNALAKSTYYATDELQEGQDFQSSIGVDTRRMRDYDLTDEEEAEMNARNGAAGNTRGANSNYNEEGGQALNVNTPIDDGEVWNYKITGEEEWDQDLSALLIVALLETAVALGYIKLVLELIERYLTLCFLFYAAPLATASIASKGTNQVFVNYMKMVFSEMLVISLNFIFIFAFIRAFNNPGREGDGVFASWGQLILYLALLIAWTKLGTRIDELLNTMGFTAARTGAGLMGAMMAAAGTTFMAARAGMRGVKMATGGVKRATQGAAGGYANATGNPKAAAFARSGTPGLIGQKMGQATKDASSGILKGHHTGDKAKSIAADAGIPVKGAKDVEVDNNKAFIKTNDGAQFNWEKDSGQFDRTPHISSGTGYSAPIPPGQETNAYVDTASAPPEMPGYKIRKGVSTDGIKESSTGERAGGVHIATNDKGEDFAFFPASMYNAPNNSKTSQVGLHDGRQFYKVPVQKKGGSYKFTENTQLTYRGRETQSGTDPARINGKSGLGDIGVTGVIKSLKKKDKGK